MESELQGFKDEFETCQSLLRNIDLLLEAHKQLSLATTPAEESNEPAAIQEPDTATASNDTTQLKEELQIVQDRIRKIQELEKALNFLSTCSIPSVAASPTFYNSLSVFFASSNQQADPRIINRCSFLIQKCWDNALVAMERVLERDLVSLEAYLDDRVYREIKDQVISPLVRITKLSTSLFKTLIAHFTTSYAQLRENFITLILDGRLNSQFSDSPAKEQVLHLIERTRLLMVVEQREFASLFNYQEDELALLVKSTLNRILESIGNLMFTRIETPIRGLSNTDRSELAAFVGPLMKSILTENDLKDPFGLFLNLLNEKFFTTPAINIKSQESKSLSSVINV